MKTSILMLAGSIVTLSACSQHIKADKVPSVVENTVKAKFTGASTIEWEKAGNIYEAEFKIGTAEWTAEIDSSGKLIRQKIEIKADELPAEIIRALDSLYKGQRVDEAEKVEKDGLVFYQVELDAKPKDLELVFSVDGTLLTDPIYWD